MRAVGRPILAGIPHINWPRSARVAAPGAGRYGEGDASGPRCVAVRDCSELRFRRQKPLHTCIYPTRRPKSSRLEQVSLLDEHVRRFNRGKPIRSQDDVSKIGARFIKRMNKIGDFATLETISFERQRRSERQRPELEQSVAPFDHELQWCGLKAPAASTIHASRRARFVHFVYD